MNEPIIPTDEPTVDAPHEPMPDGNALAGRPFVVAGEDDASTDLVDTDDVTVYDFTGGTIGNDNALVCGTCRAVVLEANSVEHDRWHRSGLRGRA